MTDIKEAIKNSTYYKGGKSLSSFKITSDANSNQLEPNYFWILDFLEGAGMDVKKIVDNFAASPGSGQFQDLGQRKGVMQQQISKLGGDINQVTKSLIQLIYDLREFEIRLSNYKDVRSDDKKKAEAARIALKQIWLDSVDIKKGHGAIHQMASQGGFTTVRDLFMMANNLDDVNRMAKDGVVNDQVRRILLPRIEEFNKWFDFSEKELTRRFQIEKSYLRSQVETLKLYTSWMGPYLKAAKELESKGFEKNPALVSAFSTSLFELTLLAKKKQKGLPDGISEKMGNYHLKRDYYSCALITLKFRGHFGQKASNKGDYAFAFGGKLDMEFDSYALNSEELNILEKELEKQSFDDGLGFFAGETEAALEQLREDFEHFLNDDKPLKDEKKLKVEDDINPFSALFGGFKSLFKVEKKSKKIKKEINSLSDLQKDNFVEKGVRDLAEKSAKGSVYAVYDIYKKVHGMASSPEGFDN